MTQKRGLGRGLGALIPGAGSTPAPEQELRTRTRPATQSEEESSAPRPVDMFFSGEQVSREEESSPRERAGARDLATGMARAAAERRSRTAGSASRSSSSPGTRTTKRTSTAMGTTGTGKKDSAATATGTTSRTTAAKTGSATTTAAKTTGAKSSGTKSAGTRSAGTTSAGAKSAGAKSAGAKSAGTRSAAVATGAKASGAKSSGTRSANTKGGASTPATAKTTRAKSSSAKTSGAKTASTSSTARKSASTAAVTPPADTKVSPVEEGTPVATSAPVENSPVVDVESVTPTSARAQARPPAAEPVPAAEPAPAEEPAAVEESTAVEEMAPENADATAPEESAATPAQDRDLDQASGDQESGDQTSGGVDETSAPAGEDRGLVSVPGAEFAEIPIHEVRENPRNPRTMFDDDELDELAHSLREVGVLQPVVVRPISVTEDGESFELVMGERRWRAARRAGLQSIPAIIRETSDDDLLRDALLENLHRSQLNPLEEANAYQQLLDDFGCTQDELGDRIGRSRPQITNTLRLLRLPALVQRRLASGALSAGHARALLSLEDPRLMEELAQRIVQEGLSVRAVERLVARGGQQPASRTVRRSTYDPHVVDLTSRLSNRLEAPVRIDVGKRKGRITLEFTNLEDLERLIENMGLDVPLPTGDNSTAG